MMLFYCRPVGGLILPPPPGASVSAFTSGSAALRPAVVPVEEGLPDALLDLDPLATSGNNSSSSSSLLTPDTGDPWGDFTSAPANAKLQSGSWEQF